MASLAASISADQATSSDDSDESHTIMSRSSYQRDDWLRLQLNEAVEDALSKILRFGFDIDRVEVKPASAQPLRNQILAWAKHIASDIPGYTNWQEIYDFTFDALCTPDAVPGSDDTPIGTEADLVAQLLHEDIDLERAHALQDQETEKDHLADHALSLAKARTRLSILDYAGGRYSGANPMPRALALLFRKIRYTYTLRECLLGQVGYYTGALELAAGMVDDFEYHMYLIQMHLRRPDRLHAFKAPKAMAHYTTDPASLLPWNNQFAFSYGRDEFGPQQVPVFGTNYIERKLVEVLRLDADGKKWASLCTLLDWNPSRYALELYRIKTEFVPTDKEKEKENEKAGNFIGLNHIPSPASAGQIPAPGPADPFLNGHQTLTDYGFRRVSLPHILKLTRTNEPARKAFYTLLLGLVWTDTPLSALENPFVEEHEYKARAERSLALGVPLEHDLAYLKDTDLRDPTTGRRPTHLTLNLVRYYPHLVRVGRRPNLILAPETAGAHYRRKLEWLSEADLDTLFGNIESHAYPRTATASRTDKVDAVVHQAVEAARDWQTCAVANHRPVYTGPSGDVLSYARIFLDSSTSDSNAQGCCAAGANHPTPEQLRLTLLAASVGFNQRHTYDECMAASHGLGFTYSGGGGGALEYRDRVGYRDIIDSADAWIREEVGRPLLRAMVKIGRECVARYNSEECQGQGQVGLDPLLSHPHPHPYPHPGPLVARWFRDTTGREFPGAE
ncbi:hypothetical protein H0H81_005794 [Sphagnurus paluster]|uniref:Uncharacterized protein n=1 Tax=Sphagnurus paluster TaxID=117069 RepID=A0A9P7KJN4_9AGAR|nr:hypothetical protein H0H81_005794 [Sphagnurus paluster]